MGTVRLREPGKVVKVASEWLTLCICFVLSCRSQLCSSARARHDSPDDAKGLLG